MADITNQVLGYLDDKDLASLRATSKSWKRTVKAYVNQSVPYATKARFIMGNADEIPEFQHRRFLVPRESAVKASAEMYFKARRGSAPAYLERIDDKDTLFGDEHSVHRQQLEAQGQVFKTPMYPVIQKSRAVTTKQVWSPQINDAWTMGHVHTDHTFELQSPPTAANLYSDTDNRPTATGREVLQLKLAGYHVSGRRRANTIGFKPLVISPGDRAAAKRLRIGDTENVVNPRKQAMSFTSEFAANLRKAFTNKGGLF